MSNWTYINGMIRVSPMGRTQAEMTYILNTVLEHLPVIQGSEGELEIYVNQVYGHDSSCSCDEFMMCTNNLVDSYGTKTRKSGWMRTSEIYLLTLNAALRDTYYNDIFRQFQKWLCRLAKRVPVYQVLVNINDYYKESIINDSDKYYDMWERPSWGNPEIEPNWCEYLMWKRYGDTSLPIELIRKYYQDEEVDRIYENGERRII